MSKGDCRCIVNFTSCSINMNFHIPDIFPQYTSIWGIMVSQTLISSLIATVIFICCLILYIKSSQENKIKKWINILISDLYEFYRTIAGEKVSSPIVMFAVMFFFYIFWLNVTWLLWDMIVWVVPSWHSFFRPASTDVIFNALLAIIWVIWSVVYWFHIHGSHFITKYFPIHWMWIVPKVTNIATFFAKIWDVAIWLLIWFIELVWELWRVLSLSLRLFGNIFVGLILIWLVLTATSNFIHIPAITPIIIFWYELCVWWLQAFIFSILVLVYHRLAAEHEH